MSVPASSESERLRALARYRILDTPAEPAFDRLAALAARVFSAPIAAISFLDRNRQSFKALCGAEIGQISRELSFCRLTVSSRDALVIPDARADERVSASALVTDSPGIAFYAGAPLLTPDGYAVGALAVLDTAPRGDLTPEQRRVLEDLAAEVMDQLELRLARDGAPARDTEQLAEEGVRRASDTVKAIIQAAPLAIVSLDVQGRVQSWNPAAERIFGWTETEILGQTFPLGATEDRELLGNVLGGATFANIDLLQRRKNGVAVRISFSAAPLHGSGGETNGLLALFADVGEQRRAETAMRESEMQFRAVFDGSLDAMCILDASWSCLDLNPAAQRLIGSGGPPAMESLREFLRQAIEQGETRGAAQWVRADGARIQIDYGVKPNFLPGRHLAILRDITEQVRLEQQLRQAQKMEAIGRLAGGVAHDFNNLLTIISGYTHMALEELQDIDQLRSNIEEIDKAADRAAGLTRQLLAFSRSQVLQLRVIDLNTVVADTEKMLRRLIGEDIELITSLAEGLGHVRADASQFEQVIMNLAVNARDAMPHGGKLLIETANIDFDRRVPRPRMPLPPGPYVTVAVSDTGIGMDQETLSHIFEPFFTTKERGKGTGLGLSTVYGIVKQSGGDVRVFSEPGHGTTFRIYLPRVTQQGEPAAGAAPASKSMRGTETILLVEDETSVRTLLCEVLRGRGYKVIEASNGAEALLRCEQFPGRIDLMISDVVLPGLRGHELAKRLAPLRPEMRVLHVSGYTDQTILNLDPANFIHKPFTPQALAVKVREILDREIR